MTAAPPPAAPPPLDGAVTLTRGDDRATIVATGARLLDVTLDTVAVTAPAPGAVAATDEFWGAVLAPWPNRLRDGVLAFDGARYRFPVNDPATATALHGTFDRAPFTIVTRTANRVELQADQPLAPPAWPSAVTITVSYELDQHSLTSRVTVTNVGDRPCPAGLGVHPYLAPGGPVDACALSIPAETELATDDRLLPIASQARKPGDLQLDGVKLDTTFGLLASTGQTPAVTLRRADGRAVTVWGGSTAHWFQVYTADTLPAPRTRTAIAIEPMTCPPDGLNSGRGAVLAPGEALTLDWGLVLADAAVI